MKSYNIVSSGVIGKYKHIWAIRENMTNGDTTGFVLFVNGEGVTDELNSIVECLAVLVDMFSE